MSRKTHPSHFVGHLTAPQEWEIYQHFIFAHLGAGLEIVCWGLCNIFVFQLCKEPILTLLFLLCLETRFNCIKTGIYNAQVRNHTHSASCEMKCQETKGRRRLSISWHIQVHQHIKTLQIQVWQTFCCYWRIVWVWNLWSVAYHYVQLHRYRQRKREAESQVLFQQCRSPHSNLTINQWFDEEAPLTQIKTELNPYLSDFGVFTETPKESISWC